MDWEIIPINNKWIELQDIPVVDSYEEDLKKKSLEEARNILEEEWVDLRFIIDAYKDAMAHSVMEWYSWAVYEDHKTRISAANKLMDLWKTSHDIAKKDAIEVVFKPIFNKPPKLM